MQPIIGCTFAYILCILFSVALVFNVAGIYKDEWWISRKLAWFGKWIPSDLGLSPTAYLSHQKTGYLELIILLACLFAVYGVTAFFVYRNTQNTQRHVHKNIQHLIWLGAIVGGSIYLFTPAALTSDIYSYASYGRLLTLYSANPYFVPPSAFPHDAVYSWLYWKDTVSIYGPIWTGVSALLALLSGSGQMGVIFTFRVFAFAVHLLNIALVAANLRAMRRSTSIVMVGTLLYAWNPLVLVESSLGAHNDVFMVTFLLLGLFLCTRAELRGTFMRVRGYIPPLLAFTFSTLIKFSAAPAIGVFIIALCCAVLRSNMQDGGRLPWRPAVVTGLTASCISGGIILLLYGPFWLGHSPAEIVNSFSSLPSAVNSFNSLLSALSYMKAIQDLPSVLFFLVDRKLWNVVTLLALLLPVAIGSIYLWRAPTARTIALVTLASLSAFLIVTPWFFAWYLTWIVGLAAVCLPVTTSRFGRALVAFVLTFSATAFLTYYSTLVGWILLDMHPATASWALRVTCEAFGLPLIVFFVVLRFWPESSVKAE
ncbi:MAG: hypothetical protein H0U76_28250, partial [Ktedonobacteraceae bacterium]|nr:hypothetical protein [Ktedonobacteraceae bacterium]